MKFFGSNKNMITKDENSENVPHLEITELVLIYCNIVILFNQEIKDL